MSPISDSMLSNFKTTERSLIVRSGLPLWSLAEFRHPLNDTKCQSVRIGTAVN